MGRRRRTVAVVAGLALVSTAAAQVEPPELRSNVCANLFGGDPLLAHGENAGRANACLSDACRGPSTPPTTLEVAVRVNGRGRATARIVEGTLGDEPYDRCVTRVLGRMPFATIAGRARATLAIRAPLEISSPSRRARTEHGPRPRTPSRESVATEMARVRPLVAACLVSEEARVLPMRLTFGGDGHVRWAEAAGTFPATVSRCAENALKRVAHLPPFTADHFTIVYPFRRQEGDAEATVASLDERAARLPTNMRGEQCLAMALGPPPRDVRGAVHGARSCLLETCEPELEHSEVTVDFELRFIGDRIRARLVRGSVGGRRAQRCMERALRHVPYPADAAGHRRVRIQLEMATAPPSVSANPF